MTCQPSASSTALTLSIGISRLIVAPLLYHDNSDAQRPDRPDYALFDKPGDCEQDTVYAVHLKSPSTLSLHCTQIISLVRDSPPRYQRLKSRSPNSSPRSLPMSSFC